jgi:hypothetical protein
MQQLSGHKEHFILEKYNTELYKLEQIIQLKKESTILSGRVKGVDRAWQVNN